MPLLPGIKAAIIDDEPSSHQVLTEMLADQHPDVEIVGSAFGVEEGHKLILKERPALVFLDIEMPDGLGFDLLEKVGRPDFYVIFITAHHQYAITAINFGALAYLLKPVTKEALFAAMQKARELQWEKVSIQQLHILLETFQKLEEKKLPSRVGISTLKDIIFLKVEEITRLEAEGVYTQFFQTGQQSPVIASHNLGYYEDQFTLYDEFMKVHRSNIVNLLYVDKYTRTDGGYLVMRDGARVKVSRSCRDELLDRLGGL